MKVANQVRQMFDATVRSAPEGTVMNTIAYSGDDKGAVRERAYQKLGFGKPDSKNTMYGVVRNGRVVPSDEAAAKSDDNPLRFAEDNQDEIWMDIVFPKDEESNVDMSEYDFARCQRPDGSYYGTAGQCRKGTPVSNAEEAQIQSALKELKSYKAGYQKTGGDNLQDPGEAAKYALFYEKDKDLSYKASKETRPEVVKEVLARLKEEDQGQYTAVMKSLNSKGSPEKTMRAEAGWTGSERGEAVLKSLMDNDFKDVLGNPAPWGQGLQLDHRTAGSVGGKDRPSNWIWISTATNQTKGGYEAAAKKVRGTGAEKEAFIKASLIKGLQGNAKMTPAQVKEVKAKGAATVAAKAEGAAKARKILPAMTPTQRGELISRSSGPQMKEILKASVAEGKNPATGRPTSYRPVLSGGNGARVRKDYGTVPQMKSLAKMRWDEPLSKSDLGNIGGILKASTGSIKSRSERLDELMGNFPRTSGLTAAERISILGAAE